MPLFKLHGSLSWSIEGDKVEMYQDMRPAFRHGGTAAIVAPIQEKSVPTWLGSVWEGSVNALSQAPTWIICGYSLPTYDLEVRRLLRSAAGNALQTILLLDPNSPSLRDRWVNTAPHARVVSMAGLPHGIEELTRVLGEP